MALKEELTNEVATIFRSRWSERDGTVVPGDDDLQLGNDAVKLNGTVLYADLADSTVLVDGHKAFFAAEIYKTFLHCAAKIIRSESGTITAYDGDRIMAVYVGDTKNTSAVRTALKIKYAVDEIINPARVAQYASNTYQLKHVVGIDTSALYVARTGVRGANDLVWVGSAANYAAKLTTLPEARATYITADVYENMRDEVKFSKKNGTNENMWTSLTWNTFNNGTIYGSSWRWRID